VVEVVVVELEIVVVVDTVGREIGDCRAGVEVVVEVVVEVEAKLVVVVEIETGDCWLAVVVEAKVVVVVSGS